MWQIFLFKFSKENNLPHSFLRVVFLCVKLRVDLFFFFAIISNLMECLRTETENSMVAKTFRWAIIVHFNHSRRVKCLKELFNFTNFSKKKFC